MTDMIDLNGDFVICERVDSESLKKDSGKMPSLIILSHSVIQQ